MESMYCRICTKRNPVHESDEIDGQYWCVDCGDYSVAPLSQHFDKLNELLETHYNQETENDYDDRYTEDSY